MKLKEIPANTVVHTPTEAEAKELLALLHENGYRDRLHGIWNMFKDETVIFVERSWINFGNLLFYKTHKGYTIITLAEFKEKYVDADATVDEIIIDNADLLKRIGGNFDPTLTDEHKRPVKVEKELNLCELLKGHEGEVFYSLIAGKCRLKEINEGAGFPICIILDACTTWEYLTKDGKRFNVSDARCILFPSPALYEQYPLDAAKAWSVWQLEQKKPFICIHWGEVDCNGDEEDDYTDNFYFSTPADRDKCIEKIQAIIEKYSK